MVYGTPANGFDALTYIARVDGYSGQYTVFAEPSVRATAELTRFEFLNSNTIDISGYSEANTFNGGFDAFLNNFTFRVIIDGTEMFISSGNTTGSLDPPGNAATATKYHSGIFTGPNPTISTIDIYITANARSTSFNPVDAVARLAVRIVPRYTNGNSVIISTLTSLSNSTVFPQQTFGSTYTGFFFTLNASQVLNYSNAYLVLSDQTHNKIINIKATTLPLYIFALNTATIDFGYSQSRLRFSHNTLTSTSSITAQCRLPAWAAISMAYNTANNTWFIFSYYDGNPVQGSNTARGGVGSTYGVRTPYNTTTNQPIVLATINSANRTFELPSPSISGRLLIVIYRIGTANPPTNFLHIDPMGNNLDGATTTIYIRPSGGNQDAAVRFVSANNQWYILDVFNSLSWDVIGGGTQSFPSDSTRNVSTSAAIVILSSAIPSGTNRRVTANLNFSTTSTTGQIHFIKDANTTTYTNSIAINSSNGGINGMSDRTTAYNAAARNRSAVIVATIEGNHYPVGFYQGY
jgi:hypothetical protein